MLEIDYYYKDSAKTARQRKVAMKGKEAHKELVLVQ